MNDHAVIRSFETGRGRRLAIVILALAVVALVIGAVAMGFRGRHISRSADALTKPVVAPAKTFPSR
jgi:uncharacterized membrane protein YjjB (DUF3815 family)